VLGSQELGAASDHCTYLSDDDAEALAASDTVHLSSGDGLRPASPTRTLASGRCRVNIALATNCNPGSSFTTSMPFCLALAVRDMGLTIDEAIDAATAGGAKALRRADVGRPAPVPADLQARRRAPRTSYRPGVPLVRATLVGGRATY
jgi:imidazolonepropionase